MAASEAEAYCFSAEGAAAPGGWSLSLVFEPADGGSALLDGRALRGMCEFDMLIRYLVGHIGHPFEAKCRPRKLGRRAAVHPW